MNVLEVGGDIGSLALIPIVIAIVVKLKNAQIDSLKEQNNILKEQVEMLELFKVSGVREQFEALKKFHEEKTKEAKEANKQLVKITKELGKLKSLSKEQVREIVALFQIAMKYISLLPSPMAQDLISQPLYMMEGPIGELWREYKDGGKLWREIKEYERKRKKERESGSST